MPLLSRIGSAIGSGVNAGNALHAVRVVCHHLRYALEPTMGLHWCSVCCTNHDCGAVRALSMDLPVYGLYFFLVVHQRSTLADVSALARPGFPDDSQRKACTMMSSSLCATVHLPFFS